MVDQTPNPIGLDSPEAFHHLQSQLAAIAAIDELAAQIPKDPDAMAEPGSELAQLVQAVAVDPPVSLLQSIHAGLLTARVTLGQIAVLFQTNLLTHPLVLQILTRAALLGAGRVVYVLGPDNLEDRRRNALTVLRQEGRSLMRGLEPMAAFEHLPALRPPTSFLEEQRRRNAALPAQSIPGEAKVLQEMADVIGRRLAKAGMPAPMEVMTESISWIWHAYSGVAHGYGWPQQVFGYGQAPGDFIADFGIVVPVAHVAFDDTLRLRTSG